MCILGFLKLSLYLDLAGICWNHSLLYHNPRESEPLLFPRAIIFPRLRIIPLYRDCTWHRRFLQQLPAPFAAMESQVTHGKAQWGGLVRRACLPVSLSRDRVTVIPPHWIKGDSYENIAAITTVRPSCNRQVYLYLLPRSRTVRLPRSLLIAPQISKRRKKLYKLIMRVGRLVACS